MSEQVLAEAASLGVRPAELALLRDVSEADLPALYSICRCFVMPSKHEGFGLPALEAMACGTPVIASNTTSLPEVVGLGEALFDPHDAGDIAERLRRVLTDSDFHARLIDHPGCSRRPGSNGRQAPRGVARAGAWVHMTASHPARTWAAGAMR